MVQLIHDVTILMSSVLLSSIANRASGFITSTSIPPFKKRSDQKILVLKAERFIHLLFNRTPVTQKTPHRIAYHVSNLSEKEQVWVFSADTLRNNTSSQECTSLKRRDATYHVWHLPNKAVKIPTSRKPDETNSCPAGCSVIPLRGIPPVLRLFRRSLCRYRVVFVKQPSCQRANATRELNTS